MFSVSSLTIQFTSRWLIRCIEVIGILALYGTKEISPQIFSIVLALALVFWGIRRLWARQESEILPDRFILLLFFLLLIVGGLVVWKGQWHPLIVTASLAPILQSLLWLGPANLRNRNWRLGMSFICLVLATSLSPDLYLAFFLFLFVVFGSICISCHYLENEFSFRSPRQLRRPLPPAFFFYGVFLAVVMFVSSLVIFPILPRPRTHITGGWGGNQGERNVGYTEEIELGQWAKLADVGGGNPVLHFFLPKETSESGDGIHFVGGLIRARAIEDFDGEKWTAWSSNERFRPRRDRSPSNADEKVVELEVIREPMGSSILPVPYGLKYMNIVGHRHRVTRMRSGAFVAHHSTRRRVHYKIQVARRPRIKDPPQPVHRHVPANWENLSGQWQELSDRLFSGVESPRTKIEKMMSFFRRAKFKVSTGSESFLRGDRRTDAKTRLSLFLFDSKAGHCELFSSSAAILLRRAGIPTRIVSGFRVTRPPVAGVLVVRQGDAHAWLEAWDETRNRWIVLDPTPSLLGTGNVLINFFSDMKELLGAYWYRYVLSFSDQERREVSQKLWQDVKQRYSKAWKGWSGAESSGFVGFVGGVIFLIAIFFMVYVFVVFRKRKKSFQYVGAKARRAALAKSRKKMNHIYEKLRVQHGAPLEASWEDILSGVDRSLLKEQIENWRMVDDELRFGPDEPGQPSWSRKSAELNAIVDSIEKEFKRAA